MPLLPAAAADRRKIALLIAATAFFVADTAAVVSGSFGPGAHDAGPRVVEAPYVPPTTIGPPATVPMTTTTAMATTTTNRAARTGGSPVVGAAAPTSSAGAAPAAPAPPDLSVCPDRACLVLDATALTGGVDHAGAGVNILPSSNADASRLRALGTTMYRSVPAVDSLGQFDWTSWDAAVAAGTPTTLVLSDLWAQTHRGGPPPTPWSNWNNYTNWVTATVQRIVATGQTVNYWDVYNEPGWSGYYSAADYSSMTPADLLQQFLVTYQAVKSVDPGAAIVGPSLGLMAFSPIAPNATTREPDMTTFLDFAAAHHLQLAAVAWHDNGQPPWMLRTDAAGVWSLIRSLPALGSPRMFLDEYGSQRTQPLPGWDVGYLALITDAGIGSAVRSCWDGCTLPTLDGLLTGAGQTTSEYFVRTTYARMSGAMIRTQSNNRYFAALGSISSSGRQVVALVGRLEGCGVESWCQTNWWPGSHAPPPAPVRISVVLPWSTPGVGVQLSYEPFQPGAASSGPLAAAPQQLSVTPDGPGREIATFTIPTFADGSAYDVIVDQG